MLPIWLTVLPQVLLQAEQKRGDGDMAGTWHRCTMGTAMLDVAAELC